MAQFRILILEWAKRHDRRKKFSLGRQNAKFSNSFLFSLPFSKKERGNLERKMTIEKSENPGAEIPLVLSSLVKISKELVGGASVAEKGLTNENRRQEYELPSSGVRTTVVRSTNKTKTVVRSTNKTNNHRQEYEKFRKASLRVRTVLKILPESTKNRKILVRSTRKNGYLFQQRFSRRAGGLWTRFL